MECTDPASPEEKKVREELEKLQSLDPSALDTATEILIKIAENHPDKQRPRLKIVDKKAMDD